MIDVQKQVMRGGPICDAADAEPPHGAHRSRADKCAAHAGREISSAAWGERAHAELPEAVRRRRSNSLWIYIISLRTQVHGQIKIHSQIGRCRAEWLGVAGRSCQRKSGAGSTRKRQSNGCALHETPELAQGTSTALHPLPSPPARSDAVAHPPPAPTPVCVHLPYSYVIRSLAFSAIAWISSGICG